MKLTLADDLALPVDVVTQTIAVLAKRRAGKSYTMRRLVEQLHRAHQQVVLVDPKGDQWGIRSAADGKGPGLPFVILGGERKDVQLEVGAGEVVAKLVVEERVSVVLDLSLFRKHEVATFMTAFMENLYRLKAKEAYRTPVMLVIDEADAIAPQKPQKGEERMLGAAEDIVRRGGQRGIGCVLVSQRSAVLNKNVLTQAQILIVLRTIAPQDLAAMKAWIEVHGDEAQGRELMASLPSLPVGDAWVWSPGWPTVDGIFNRIHVLPIETFDSGATPKPGEQRREPKQVAEVDLDALTRQMAATIEKAKADDPRELRKQIAELKKQLASKVDVTSARPGKTVAKPVLTENDRTLIGGVAKNIESVLHELKARRQAMDQKLRLTIQQALKDAFADLQDADERAARALEQRLDAKGFQKILGKLTAMPETPIHPQRATVDPRSPHVRRMTPAPVMRRPAHVVSQAADSNGGGSLPDGEAKVLAAVVQHGQVDRSQISILTGYKRSTRNTYLQRLQQAGHLVIQGDTVMKTAAGEAALGDYEALPTGDALRAHWLQRLPEGERAIFSIVCHFYPEPLDRDAITERTGYKRSTRNTYIQRLMARKLVTNVGDGVVAAPDLFS